MERLPAGEIGALHDNCLETQFSRSHETLPLNKARTGELILNGRVVYLSG